MFRFVSVVTVFQAHGSRRAESVTCRQGLGVHGNFCTKLTLVAVSGQRSAWSHEEHTYHLHGGCPVSLHGASNHVGAADQADG
jgi:hypothetical protein